MSNRPFKLDSVPKDYLWGGSRLKDEFNKRIDITSLAESWECSIHPEGLSQIASGIHVGDTLKEVLTLHPEYLGSRFKGQELKVLIKLIDAKDKLSVQVHPDDEYALANENGQNGKTEMWYVLDAEKGAEIIFGLHSSSNQDDIRNAITKGSIEKYLQKVKVHKGDVFFVQPGIIHAIGAGCLIAEIQENSNLTYRLYDYDRLDKYGNKRTLHIDKAMEVASFNKAIPPRQPLRVLNYKPGMASEFLCRCKYFEVHRMIINSIEGIDYRTDDLGFRVLLCIEGEGVITYDNEQMQYYKGDCIFIPADSSNLKILGKAQFLDVRG